MLPDSHQKEIAPTKHRFRVLSNLYGKSDVSEEELIALDEFNRSQKEDN